VLSTAGQAPVRIDAAPASVIDVTGAGDALTAGFIHGLLCGHDPYDAARLGHRAAALTVASSDTVRSDLGQAFPEGRGPESGGPESGAPAAGTGW
jgi:pseudouridine kinase